MRDIWNWHDPDKMINDIKSHKYYFFIFKFRLVFFSEKNFSPYSRMSV